MIDTTRRLDFPSGASRTYYSHPLLEHRGVTNVSRLPFSLRILLESVLRNRHESVPLVLRIDTPIEAAYFSAGGILPYMLDQLLAEGAGEEATS